MDPWLPAIARAAAGIGFGATLVIVAANLLGLNDGFEQAASTVAIGSLAIWIAARLP